MARKGTVIIVGGGISGIAAAAELTQKGVDIVILEARDRIGGRIKTERKPDGRVYDLGASWLHETFENKLMDVALEGGIGLAYDDSGYTYYDKNGAIPRAEKHHAVMDEIYQKTLFDYNVDKNLQDVSLKAYTKKYLRQNKTLDNCQKSQALSFVRQIELLHALPWDQMSSKFLYTPPSGRDAYVKDGYDLIFNQVAESIDNSHAYIKLNTEVVSIGHGNAGVTVKDANGDIYRGDFVIVTLPAAVLKDDWKKLFGDDVLPLSLQHAMDTASIGALGKVFLEFDQVFWQQEFDRMTIVPNEGAENGEPYSAPFAFIDGYRLFGRPCLVSLMAPPITNILEASPEKVPEYYVPMLEKLRVDKSKPLPNIKHFEVTDWTVDKYARGSYSALATGQTPETQLNPFVEGFGHIRFAGEHTSMLGAGCTHGAYESGKREAQWVINKLQ